MDSSRMLGDYNLVRQLGQGSLGTVFLAEHRFMKKTVVIKVLPEELSSDGGFIRRFEEDVSKLSQLDHPHLVKIHNVSHHQGRYFIVTDAIVDKNGSAQTLTQYMLSRSKRLGEETLFDLLSQIASALDYAHGIQVGGRPLVHLGLKLNNILIKQEQDRVEAFVSDFGLSRIVGTGAVLTQMFRSVAQSLGIAGSVLAESDGRQRYPSQPVDRDRLSELHASFLQSFAFLAPEQKRLDKREGLNAAVDAYAFGVLAYYLIMGEAPEAIFPLPSEKATEYRWSWDGLISACLQRDPTRRPVSLMLALEEVRKEIGVELALPTTMKATATKEALALAIAPAYAVAGVAEQANTSSAVLAPRISAPQLHRPQVDMDPARAFQIDSAVSHYQPEAREVTDITPLQTDMVIIKDGHYYRGSTNGNRDEMPRHQVTLSPFAIDIHPVTNEAFVRFLTVMGGEKDIHHRDLIRLRDSRIKRSGGKLSIESGYHKHPVVGVTWYGCIAYAQWVGKRLPTEAEWEVAASGAGANLIYPTGDDIEKSQANFFSSDTTPVMSYPPTAIGLYDIAGNVYEWCYDWYAYNAYELSIQEPENPKGPVQGVYRVLRGGCWKSLKEDLRCSRRHRNNPGTVNGTYGFRCAADVA